MGLYVHFCLDDLDFSTFTQFYAKFVKDFRLRNVTTATQRTFRLAIFTLSLSFCMVGVPALGKSMTVNCIRQPGKEQEKCSLDIYNSVLKGRNGDQVKVMFVGGYYAEAFCIDTESRNCWG